MADLPGAVHSLHQHERLKAAAIDHLGVERGIVRVQRFLDVLSFVRVMRLGRGVACGVLAGGRDGRHGQCQQRERNQLSHEPLSL